MGPILSSICRCRVGERCETRGRAAKASVTAHPPYGTGSGAFGQLLLQLLGRRMLRVGREYPVHLRLRLVSPARGVEGLRQLQADVVRPLDLQVEGRAVLLNRR